MQSDLFSTGQGVEPIRLPMEDAEVSFLPSVLTTERADMYFTLLRDSLAWQEDHIRMYGKQVKIPRLQAWYGDPEAVYQYSGLTMVPHKWTAPLLELKSICEERSATVFNSVLANYYRDGRDSMGWHADDEPELGVNPVIASLSFGQARDFDFRHKATGEKKRFSLPHGSLLIMSGETQKNWLHGISKRASALAGRINLTFRTIFPID